MKIILGIAKKSSTHVMFDEKKGVRTKEGEIRIGVEKRGDVGHREFARLVRNVIRQAQQYRLSKLSLNWKEVRSFKKLKNIPDEELIEMIATNAELANYNFNDYKSKPKDGWPAVAELVLELRGTKVLKDAFKRGLIIADEMNKARTLANIPGGDMTPKKLAAAAKAAVKELSKTRVQVLGQKEMQKMKMGCILGVAQGSSHEPQLIVMHYSGGAKSQKPIVLVGKGITYDTGGLSIKPSQSMIEMFMDMSGGAVVIHAIAALARLKVKKNVIAVIPAAENSVGDKSYRPGDVLRSMSGKTVEVRNTDAEGRLVLADAITYAQKKFDPHLIVDVATLTGAALVALGQMCSAVLSRDEKLLPKIQKLGEETGDLVWPLPLWDEYKKEIASKRADVSNIATSRWGGTIEGGMFLAEFVDDKQPWVHIDMAPRMESVEIDNLAPGSTGEPMRLLTKLVEVWK